MATSNQFDERFCSFCDPSPIKAMSWCLECNDFFLSSVILLTKEWSSLRVCSRSNIAGDDLTFEIKSAIGATPEHSLCAVNRTSDITLEFSKIKERASDLQIFLSLPHLISKANDEEKHVEKLGSCVMI
jgi:hypothetical protein